MSLTVEERRRIYEEEKVRVQEPRKSGFNWWALLFGPFWYFYKGLWGKGLLLAVAAILASGITFFVFGLGGFLVWLWAAAKANEDYYIHWRQRQQALGNLPTGNTETRSASSATLPPEERRRIYEEEKARIEEARKSL